MSIDNIDQNRTGENREYCGHTPEELIEKFHAPREDRNNRTIIGTILQVDKQNKKCHVWGDGHAFTEVPWTLPYLNTDTGQGFDFTPSVNQRCILAITHDDAAIIGFLPEMSEEEPNETNYKKNRAELEHNDMVYRANEDFGTSIWALAKGVLEFRAESWTKTVIDAVKGLFETTANWMRFINPTIGEVTWRAFTTPSHDRHTESFFKWRMKQNTEDDTPITEGRVGAEKEEDDTGVFININKTEADGENPLQLYVESDVFGETDSNIEVRTTGANKVGDIDIILEEGDFNNTVKEGDHNTHVQKGDKNTDVDEGDENIIITEGDFTREVSEGDISEEVGGDAHRKTDGEIILEAGSTPLESTLLGQTTVAELNTMAGQVATHFHPTPMGPSGPPTNASFFTQWGSQLGQKVLSEKVKNN